MYRAMNKDVIVQYNGIQMSADYNIKINIKKQQILNQAGSASIINPLQYPPKVETTINSMRMKI